MNPFSHHPPFSWRCPFCQRDTTITENDLSRERHVFSRGADNALGWSLESCFIRCPNSECGEISVDCRLFSVQWELRERLSRWVEVEGEQSQFWHLVPSSDAVQFPEYVPEQIRRDYEEACLIRSGSPRAAATLARRCLQGMIRNFWGVNENTLYAEINAIQDKVAPDTWEAIDAVRKIGNIGGHMERDVNLMVDIQPDEVQALLELIEMLVEDWYTARHERQARLAEIRAIGEEKDAQRKGASISSDTEEK